MDAIGQLLGLHCVFEASSKVDAQVEDAHDLASASSTSLVDFMAQNKGALSNTNETEDVDHEEDFFTITRRYRTTFYKKNTFSQTMLLIFFRILHLIDVTNVNSMAHKTTFG